MDPRHHWTPEPELSPGFSFERSRNLGWWVFLAVLVSVAAHVALYLALGALEWQRKLDESFSEDIVFENRREKLTIDQESLEQLLPQPVQEPDPVTPDNLSNMPLLDESLDEFELQEQMLEKEVRLTPEVDTAQIFTAERPMVSKELMADNLPPVEIAASEFITEDLNVMRKQLLEVDVASHAQPLIELNMSELDQGPDSDDFFRKAASKATKGDPGRITKGYSQLDDLIGRTGGGLPSGTAPILLPTDLLFDYDSYEVRESARLSLMKLAFLIQTNPDSRFIIEGHTDNFGDENYNYQLSLRRAGAIRDWLLETLKIDGSSIQAVGYGKTRPLVSTDGTVEDQALNRRVEIVIRKK